MELNSQKTAITHNLQLLHKELSTDESDIPVTRKLPNTHIRKLHKIQEKALLLIQLDKQMNHHNVIQI